VTPVFGRIRLPNAAAPVGAMIMTDKGPVEVDDSGFFQIEAADGGQVDVRLADGSSCELNLPAAFAERKYVSAGDLMCDSKVRLGSARLSKAAQ
jgi:hypothetical protein